MIREDGKIVVYGHDEILDLLSKSRPTRALFVGPYSSGKRTTFEWYAEEQHLENIQRVYDLNESIEYIQGQARFLGQTFFITLSKASEKNVEKLLKVVEDSDPSNVFIISSTYMPKITLSSRLEVFEFSYLDATAMQAILAKLGHSDAAELASMNHGTVSSAIASKNVNRARVNLAISYINDHDLSGVDSLYKKWTEEDTSNIIALAKEVVTGLQRMFTQDEISSMSKKLAMKILLKVDPFDRPRYVVRASLVGIAQELSR